MLPVVCEEGQVSNKWTSELASDVESFISRDLSTVSCLAVAALAVLDVNADAQSWPVFRERRQSLFKALVLRAGPGTPAFWAALEVATDEDVVVATNIARWLLEMPQQPLSRAESGPLVFVSDPVPAQRTRRAPAARRRDPFPQLEAAAG